ncbi:MAG: 4Fe-4S binding protein [Proteobacteria bacterium]|nr:4Fe-4S binding protein [Pseudomonadota bacterium]
MKESTKIMFRKHGVRVDRFIHNYIYFLFYYPYVKTVRFLLYILKYLTWFQPLAPVGRMAFSRYHAKVLSFSDTRKIFELNRDIRVIAEENKQIIPFKYATKIVFQEPEYIAVMDCPCKKSNHADEADINSCIAVGKGLATFWLDHCKKYNARKISQEEALDIIRRLRAKNHITQAFFKVATGGSTGVICNCHPDTCVSLQATMLTRKIEKNVSQSAASGYSLVQDSEKCNGCGQCVTACAFDCISYNGGSRKYDRNACMGCELCVEKCPQNALSLYVDPEKPLPLDLDKLMTIN